MDVDATGLRVLTSSECLSLLREVSVGRVAVSHRALPVIVPVHFHLDDADRIRITATEGSTLHRATAGTVVAFEAEGPAGSVEPGWSVVLHGLATHAGSTTVEGEQQLTDVVITVDQISGEAFAGPPSSQPAHPAA